MTSGIFFPACPGFSALLIVVERPTQTFCLLQDENFIRLFVERIGFGLLTNLGLYALLLLLPWWWVTRPYVRASASSLGMILVAGGFPFGSWLVSAFPAYFPAVDPEYLNCRGFDFGAPGILGFGRGTALVFQPFLMGVVFFGALLAWLGVSLLATKLLSGRERWPWGLRHSLRGEGS